MKQIPFLSEPYICTVYTVTVLSMSYLSSYATKVNASSLKEEKFEFLSLRSSYHYFENFRIPYDFKGNFV